MEGKTIGICGGIGSGKSVVSRVLRLRGEAVYDCDFEARRIMDSSKEVIGALCSRYGDSVCPAGGPICRPELARRVFGDDKEREWLNSLVHRLVRDDVRSWREARWREGHTVCYVESAILVTSGLAAMCDAMISVDAPEDVRIARVAGRDGLDPESIRRRIASQREEALLAARAGVPVATVVNDGTASLLAALDSPLFAG